MTSLEELTKRVTHLEEVLAHHERTVEQLNKVVVDLHTQNDRLQHALTRQTEQLAAVQQSLSSDHDPNEKPPHY